MPHYIGDKIELSHTIFESAENFTDCGTYIKCSCPNKAKHKNNDNTPSFVHYKGSHGAGCFACGHKATLSEYAVMHLNISPSKIHNFDNHYFIAYSISKAIFSWAKEELLLLPEDHIVKKYFLSRRIKPEHLEYMQFGYFGNIEKLKSLLSVVHDVDKSFVESICIGMIKSLSKNKLLTFFQNPSDGAYYTIKARKIDPVFSFDKTKSETPEYREFKKYSRTSISVFKTIYKIITEGKIAREFDTGYFAYNDVINSSMQAETNKSEVVIVEGEFDAMAIKSSFFDMMSKNDVPLNDANNVYYSNVIATGGTSNVNSLGALVTNNVNKIVVLFDSDEAGQDAIKKIIDKATIGSYYIGQFPEIYKDPDEYMEDHDFNDFEKIIKSAKTIPEFLIHKINELIKEDFGSIDKDNIQAVRILAIEKLSSIKNDTIVQDVCSSMFSDFSYFSKEAFYNEINNIRSEMKIKQHFSVYEHNGATWRITNKEKKVKLANFVIIKMYDIYTDFGGEKMIRKVYLINEMGQQSPTFFLYPEMMTSADKFKTLCHGFKNFSLFAKNEDMDLWWEMKMHHGSEKEIYAPSRVGYLKQHKCFLFGDCIVENGHIFTINDPSDRMIWVSNNKGFSLDLSGLAGEEATTKEIPHLLTSRDILDKTDNKKFDFDKVEARVQQISSCVLESVSGGLQKIEYDALYGLGWAVACIFKDVIVKHYSDFPFIFLAGQKLSGKSTYGRWLMRMFGMESEGESIDSTTWAAQRRNIDYYCNIPYWLEEFSNSKKVQEKTPWYKSVYSQSSTSLGNKDSSRGIIKQHSNAPIMFSGEHMPKDAGLSSRCVTIQFSENKRKKSSFEKTNFFSKQFFVSFLVHTTRLRTTDMEKALVKRIQKRDNEFLDLGFNDRAAKHMAIIYESYVTVFKNFNDELLQFIKDSMIKMQDIHDDVDPIFDMFTTIKTMFDLGEFEDDEVLSFFDIVLDESITDHEEYSDDIIGMKMLWDPVYEKYGMFVKKRPMGQDGFVDKNTMELYLKDKDYIVKDKKLRIFFEQEFTQRDANNGKTKGYKRDDVIFFHKKNAPDALVALMKKVKMTTESSMAMATYDMSKF